jgi:hypothetical protein
MDNNLQPWTAQERPPDTNPAEAAFTELSSRIAVVETLLRGIAAKREAMPDYSGTLEEMAALLEKMRKAINTLAARPAMQITRDEMTTQVAAAAAKARAEDAATIAQAQERMTKAAARIEYHEGRVATARDQRRHRHLWGIGGLLGGIALWSFLPGVTLRALPQGWHMPENMARHIIGEPTLWDAGTRLMWADSPRAWDALSEAANMLHDNRDAIKACQRAAAKTKKPARCTVTVAWPG